MIATHIARIGPGQLLEQDFVRPLIHHDVVEHQHQQRVLARALDQRCPRDISPFKVKRRIAEFTGGRVDVILSRRTDYLHPDWQARASHRDCALGGWNEPQPQDLMVRG